MTDTTALDTDDDLDSLLIGKRIRSLRTERGMTLEELGAAIGRAASQVSVLENGKREPRISDLTAVARALGVTIDDLLTTEPPSRRAALEIQLERIQRGPLYASLGLPELPVRKSLSDDAIETVLGLHAELERLHRERAATPEEARRANTELRAQMRRQNNYFPDLEKTARDLLARIGHSTGPLSNRAASDLAAHLGFSLHYVTDLPASTRSISDLRHKRIYLPVDKKGGDPRGSLLRALAGHVLGATEPTDYGHFLLQRVETNYLAAALMIPQASATEFLQRAKDGKELSVDDLRDEFAVTYETAAHRFTNLVTEHLGIPVHFLKVHESGTISKAYENDDAKFPTDALGAVEGQVVCRFWSARQVFDIADRFSPYHQYTDKPNGTYWCTSSIQSTAHGEFSVSVGTPFATAKWFRGRDTQNRKNSGCPDPNCCRRPPERLASAWAQHTFPSPRLQSSLLAAVPAESFTGVDRTEVFEFLEAHAPGEGAR
ncbi:MAG TPA: helix-turn-helix domain-containing protein [Terrimesophilobacter sp.]|nr:helix-turn-helix domain-containing protein [Terrimesophilobacter sp.]HRP99507.1 helix-turn-helix domain-containing protein [Terrimesophilobacter sp.]